MRTSFLQTSGSTTNAGAWQCPARIAMFGHPFRAKIQAFTLLELMVAMAVLSVLMIILVSMVEGATQLWRASENRVDSFREARAALNIISSDLASIYVSTNTALFQADPASLLPSETKNLNTKDIANSVFFLSALPANAQDPNANKSDICAVGYFMDYARTSQRGKSSYNLYRYFKSSDPAFVNLKNNAPFDPVAPISQDVELLAKNITKFRIQAKTIPFDANGKPDLKKSDDFTQSINNPLPDYLDITLTAVNQETADRLGSDKDEWFKTNDPTIKQNARTFTTRIYLDGAARAKPTPTPSSTP